MFAPWKKSYDQPRQQIKRQRHYFANKGPSTGREEGGGFRMGNTCIPVVNSCWYMAKLIQYCKVKKKKKSYGFSSGQVWMWELDHKENWVPKNWCFWTVVLEKTLESPLDCKEIQPVHPKGNQSWIIIGRTDAQAEAPILWLSDAKNWLIWKDPDAGKDWKQEEKGTTEDEMAGWHHRLDGREFE